MGWLDNLCLCFVVPVACFVSLSILLVVAAARAQSGKQVPVRMAKRRRREEENDEEETGVGGAIKDAVKQKATGIAVGLGISLLRKFFRL